MGEAQRRLADIIWRIGNRTKEPARIDPAGLAVQTQQRADSVDDIAEQIKRPLVLEHLDAKSRRAVTILVGAEYEEVLIEVQAVAALVARHTPGAWIRRRKEDW